MSRIAIYCAGGAGFNVGSHFAKHRGQTERGFASIETYFLDTSRSNMHDHITKENLYLLDGTDGSGKVRASNYNSLVECSKEILHQFKPGDLNIVLHSTGGGTGSTLGPILVSELLSRGQMVVAIMIGSTASRIEVENTIKTLKSYESISAKRGVPVVAAYRQNGPKASRSQVDAEIQTGIVALAAVFSGENRELDSADLRNFLNYHTVTTFAPKLTGLEFFSESIHLGKNQTVVSLATLIDDTLNSDPGCPVEYQAVGYVPENVKSGGVLPLPLHGCVISGYYNGIVDSLNDSLKVFDENRRVFIEKPIVTGNENAMDDGTIL